MDSTDRSDCLWQIRSHRHSRDKEAAARAVVLSAVSEAILEHRGSESNDASAPPPSPTEYFSALMTALESVTTESASSKLEPASLVNVLTQTNAKEILYILSTALPHVPRAVISLKAEPCLQVFIALYRVLERLSDVERPEAAHLQFASLLQRHLVTCVGLILSKSGAGKDEWERPVRVQALHITLASLGAEQPKLRRCAQAALRDVLTAHGDGVSPAVSLVAQVVNRVLADCTITDSVRTLQLLSFLPSILPFLIRSASVCRKITKALLRLAAIGHGFLSKSALQSLDAICTNARASVNTRYALDKTLVESLVRGLLDLHPSQQSAKVDLIRQEAGQGSGKGSSVENDSAVAMAWVVTLSHAMDLARVSGGVEMTIKHAPSAVSCLVAIFSLQDASVNQATGSGLVHLLNAFFESVGGKAVHEAALLSASVDVSKKAKDDNVVIEIVASLSSIVSPQMHSAWPNAMPVLSTLFELVGSDDAVFLCADVLKQLVLVRESIVNEETGEEDQCPPWKAVVEAAIGGAITGLGADRFLSLVPLDHISSNTTVFNPKRAWLLPLLRLHLRDSPTRLTFFRTHVLVLARQCIVASSQAGPNEVVKARVLRMRGVQLYGLFPSFCARATDTSTEFKLLAKTLGDGLGDTAFPELAVPICKGIRVLVDENRWALAQSSAQQSQRGGLATIDEDGWESSDLDGNSDDDLFDFDDEEDDDDDEDEQAGDKSYDDNMFGEFDGLTREGKQSVSTQRTSRTGNTIVTAATKARHRSVQRRLARARRMAPAPVWFSAPEAEKNLAALNKFAKNFLPLLFNLHDEAARQAHGTGGMSGAAGERAVAVLSVARSYASIASKSMLGGLFKDLLQRLLTAMNDAVALGCNNRTQGVPAAEDVEAKLVQARNLAALSLALVSALDSEQLDLLVRTLEPIISEAATAPRDNILQKRAYKVLEGLCKCNPSWIITKRSELVTLLQQALTASSPSAKTARLHCLKYILRALYRPPTPTSAAMLNPTPSEEVETISWPDALAVVSELVGDVILCTKEPNNKARAASFRVILEMAKCLDITFLGVQEAAESSGNSDELSALNELDGGGAGEFLRMLVGGLAAKTPHMRSASVVAISRIVNDYGHRHDLQNMLPDLVRTVVLLLDEKSREVAKSALTFAKVCVVRIPEETMEECLDDVTRALLPWADDTKNQFSLKIRIVFERMAKKFTIERLVLNGCINEDHKILTYIRKQQAYKRRRFLKKRGAVPDDEVPGGPARANGKRGVTFKKNSNKKNGNDSDSDSDDSEVDADMGDSWESRQRKRRLDGTTMNAGTGKSGGKDKKDNRMQQPGLLEGARFVEDMDDGDGEAVDLLDTSALGRLMIGDKPRKSNGATGRGSKRALASDAFPVAEDGRLIIGTEEERKRSAVGGGMAEDSDDDEEEGAQGKKKRVRHGTNDGTAADTGAAFRSRKAKGDVQRKGQKHEPYAYVPLDARMLNKRKKHEAGRQFSGVVRGKGQGPAKGAKAKRANEDGVRRRR